MIKPINQEWGCKYCKKKFKFFFERDLHMQTHPEHYKRLFQYLLEVVMTQNSTILALEAKISKLSRKEAGGK